MTKLNPFFQEEHLKDEIIKLQQDTKLKEKERDMYTQKKKRISRKSTKDKKMQKQHLEHIQ